MTRFNVIAVLFVIAILTYIGASIWIAIQAYETPGDELTEQSKREVDGVSLFLDFKEDATAAEGRQMTVYWEPISAKLHAGIGHLLTTEDLKVYSRGDTLTDAVVDKWFDIDYRKVMMGVAKYFPDFNEYPHLVKLALMNWIYQLGEDAPKKFPRATEAIHKQDWNTAADEWEYASVRTRRHSKWYRETSVRCRQEAERLRHAAKEESGE